MNTEFTNLTMTELTEIERQARAMQAQVMVSMFRSLRSSIASLWHRSGTRHTA